MNQPVRDLMMCKARGILAWVTVGSSADTTERQIVACLDKSERCRELNCRLATGEGDDPLLEAPRGVAAGI